MTTQSDAGNKSYGQQNRQGRLVRIVPGQNQNQTLANRRQNPKPGRTKQTAANKEISAKQLSAKRRLLLASTEWFG